MQIKKGYILGVSVKEECWKKNNENPRRRNDKKGQFTFSFIFIFVDDIKLFLVLIFLRMTQQNNVVSLSIQTDLSMPKGPF